MKSFQIKAAFVLLVFCAVVSLYFCSSIFRNNISNIYNMSGRVVSDIQTRAEG